MAQERLQKIIARAGLASRRGAEQLIQDGKVSVNGEVITELGSKADADKDHVKVNGKLITHSQSKRYILLFKPRQVMTTVDDPEGRRTVLQFIKGVKERVFPVGRLDFHSEGLILLTNDGDLAFKVAHPSHGSIKTYRVKVRGLPSERMIDKLRKGITIGGRRTATCEIRGLRRTGRGEEGNSWFEVKLGEGRTQQIRKMYKAIGHPVMKLRRTAIGALVDPTLEAGQWRDLTEREVSILCDPPPVKEEPAPRKISTRAKRAPSLRKTSTRAKRAPSSTSGRSSSKTAAKQTSATKRPASRKRAPEKSSRGRDPR